MGVSGVGNVAWRTGLLRHLNHKGGDYYVADICFIDFLLNFFKNHLW